MASESVSGASNASARRAAAAAAAATAAAAAAAAASAKPKQVPASSGAEAAHQSHAAVERAAEMNETRGKAGTSLLAIKQAKALPVPLPASEVGSEPTALSKPAATTPHPPLSPPDAKPKEAHKPIAAKAATTPATATPDPPTLVVPSAAGAAAEQSHAAVQRAVELNETRGQSGKSLLVAGEKPKAVPPLPVLGASTTQAATVGAAPIDIVSKMQATTMPEAQRSRILARVAHLEGTTHAGAAKELQSLRHALGSNNAARAALTWEDLGKMASTTPQAAQRLDADTRAALVHAVADSRASDTPTGGEGVMGRRQAQDAARALIAMPQAQLDTLKASLGAAGQGPHAAPKPGADANAEQALMLKAVAARADELSNPVTAAKAMTEIKVFGDGIRGMDRSKLIGSTSPLGVTDFASVGLDQHWTHSCGPTVAQFLKGEQDPIFAQKLRADPAFVGAQQKGVLEQPRFYDKDYKPLRSTAEQDAAYRKDGTLPSGAMFGRAGVAVSRDGVDADLKLAATLHPAHGSLSAQDAAAVQKRAHNERLTPQEQVAAEHGLAQLRNSPGALTPKDLAAIQSNYTQNPDGSSTLKEPKSMPLPPALRDLVGGEWKEMPTNEGRGGLSPSDLAATEERLNIGVDVPLVIVTPKPPPSKESTGGHFMMATDVRGTAPHREYLIADPWSGKSSWVTETDFKDQKSKWPQRHFGVRDTMVKSIYAR